MKVFKKILKVLFVLVVILTYLNIGYWYGISFNSAIVKAGKGEKLNWIENLQTGNGKMVEKALSARAQRKGFKETERLTICIFAWPGAVFIGLIAWLIVGGGLAVKGAVFLFKFVFKGEFFTLIGPAGVALVIGSIVFVFLVRRSIRRHNRAKLEG